MNIATFAAGCFWGIEAQFRPLNGVISTRVGYTGGITKDPNYKLVCTGTTEHAEAIEITFDPDIISYQELLNFFWKIHDPTTLNRQGPDIGSQYRSAIFYHNKDQKQQALNSIQALTVAKTYFDPIVTEVTAASIFYPAEEYHQCYLEKKGQGSCH
ncbi:MAG: peptide-methionine (S)-S-oxide reductase MsrA [Gammaproteobacteria bacterium]|nr:peptide-methionine (S)-S-oxide reductase MsrA [Gammaproteobacteria bacterium]